MANREGKSRPATIFDSLPQRKIEMLRAVIRIDEEGLSRVTHFSDGATRTAVMKWNEISRIVAFKRDLAACDLVCVAVTAGLGGAMVMDEGMEGFEAMVEALPARVPGAPTVGEWWEKLIQPPIATNWTILFSEQK